MVLGFAPNVIPETVNAIRRGLIPIDFLVIAILVTMIPLAAVIIGATLLRRFPKKLLVLGYGVEGPSMLLLLARIYLVRQATPAVILLYILSLLGMLTLLWQLMDLQIDQRGRVLDSVRISGLTWLFLVGIYAAVIVAFYVVPITIELPELIAECRQ